MAIFESFCSHFELSIAALPESKSRTSLVEQSLTYSCILSKPQFTMASTTTNNSKFVYMAVPLLSRENQDAVLETAENESLATNTNQGLQKYGCRAFFSGMLLGFFCYCLVDSDLIPSLRLEHVFANSMATALLWSSITSIIAYGVFWFSWSMMEQHYYQSNNKNEKPKNDTLFEHMEYYYTLGVFLGFCMACTIDVILFGIPLVGVLSMVAVATMWTWVMIKVAPEEEPRATVLPMVVV